MEEWNSIEFREGEERWFAHANKCLNRDDRQIDYVMIAKGAMARPTSPISGTGTISALLIVLLTRPILAVVVTTRDHFPFRHASTWFE
jgi:hypothetical protein